MNPLGLFLEPPGPLLTHLHTVYMGCSERLPTRLNPLAERTCFSQVSCASCANTTADALVDVTFGDVWFCSGQSNMWLPMNMDTSRNVTYDAILAGKYKVTPILTEFWPNSGLNLVDFCSKSALILL